jgi:hypothetical protein
MILNQVKRKSSRDPKKPAPVILDVDILVPAGHAFAPAAEMQKRGIFPSSVGATPEGSSF